MAFNKLLCKEKKITKFIYFAVFIFILNPTSILASPRTDAIGISTATYDIKIIDVCNENQSEEECVEVKYEIYEKVTKKTIYAGGKSVWSKHLLDDGTLSGSKICCYIILIGSERWEIGIPFGGLTKFDRNGKEFSHESGEWKF